MAERIVVGTDGSTAGERVLDHAAARAARIGAVLEIVQVVELPPLVEPSGLAGPGPDVDRLQADSREVLDRSAARIAGERPELKVLTRSEIGNPVQILAELSEGAECLFVGRRGIGGLETALLGSVSSGLASHARCPLVVIGDQMAIPTEGPVVVGLDDSEFSVAAARFALAEAAALGVTLRAVNGYRTAAQVVPTEPELIDALREGERTAAEQALDATLSQAGAASADVVVQKITLEATPVDAVLSQSADAQLVVVGSQGKGLIRRLVLGSVSRKVLQEATLPVAVINLATH